ncbi:MAG TPA: protein kinase [Polyangiaceae bacterium]|nr:protein kinase [Polyangiaceae bacterium]
MSSPPLPNLPACLGGKYRPIRQLGTGGMGWVLEVEHVHTGERLALKLLHARARVDRRAVDRFRREARIAVRLKSEHVVRVLDADVADELEGAPFLVMELLEGDDLGAVAGAAPQPPARVVGWLRQAASALDRAHALGVVHRDLKPENLFLTRGEGGAPLVKVLDFGIAKLLDTEPTLAGDGAPQTTTGAVFGTPLYMSPEQATGAASDIGPPSDFWSLAMVAYRLLTGVPYWKAASPAHVLAQIVYEPVAPPSARGFDLGEAFDRWFLRSCRRAPASRWPSAAAQIEALAEALAEPVVPLPAAPPVASRDYWTGPTAETLGGAPEPDAPAGPGRARQALTTTLDPEASTRGATPPPAERPRANADPAPGGVGVAGGAAAPPRSAPGLGQRLRGRPRLWGGLALAAALAGALASPLGARLGGRARDEAAPAPSAARPFVLVLSFRGADERWPGLLSELLAEQLRLGDALRTPSPDARVEMGRDIGSRAPPAAAELARLRRAGGVDVVVTGRARQEGDVLHATIEAYDAARGAPLGEAFSLRGPADDPIGFAREAGMRVRTLLGRPQLSVDDDLVLRAALPEGAAATAAYVRGLAARRRFRHREAAAHFEETLRRSPRYGPAWVGLAQAQLKLGEYKRAQESAGKAVEFAPSLPRADELSVYALAATARRDLATAAEKYRLLVQFYPDRVDYTTSLAYVLTDGGRSAEALATLAEAKRRSLSGWDRVRVALATAYAYMRRSEGAELLAALDEAEAFAEETGASAVLAEVLQLRADVYQRAGRLDEAEPLFERAREIFADADATAGLLLCDSGLARIAELRGDFDRAIGLYERILERRHEDGNAYGIARETVQLGIVYAAMGRLSTAREYLDRGGALFEAINDREGGAHRAVNVATIDLELGSLAGVRERASRGRAIHAEIGYRAGVAEADGLLARLAWLEGKPAEAEAGFEAALREAREAGESELTADVAVSRARLAFERGDAAEPARFEDARAAVAAAGSSRLDALFHALASRRALALGDAAGARRHALEAEASGRQAHSIDALALALTATLEAFAAAPAASAPKPGEAPAAPRAPARAEGPGAGAPELGAGDLARRRDELERLLGTLEAVGPRLEALSALARTADGDRAGRLREIARIADEKGPPWRALAARMELGLALATPAGARDAAAAEAQLRALGAKGLAHAVRARTR